MHRKSSGRGDRVMLPLRGQCAKILHVEGIDPLASGLLSGAKVQRVE